MRDHDSSSIVRRAGFVTFAVVAAVVFTLTPAPARGAVMMETRFTVVDSSSSSWVARGFKNYTVNAANGWSFTSSRNFDNGININLNGPALPGTGVDYWRLEFAAPGNAQITPGLYPNFQRFPFQNPDRPGLAFASTGRLDNQAAGVFEVFEATYGPTGDVLSFAANFTHYGETNPNNWAIAEIRYNAAVPEPAGVATIGLAANLLRRRRRRRRS